MKNIIKSFRPVIIPLIICLIVSQLPLSPALAEENITITTYYPSPSGSYLDLNVQGTMLVGTGTPASGVSSRIEFSHNTSSLRSHWNIDQDGSPSSNNTTNPRLRFFTEPNSNTSGSERFVLDNTSMTFRNSTGAQRLLVNDSNILYTSGTTNAGDFILRAPTTDTIDPGDIIFQRGNSPYNPIGRIWSVVAGGDNVMRFSVSTDNAQPIEIRETGAGTWINPYKNDLHITRGNLFIDNLGEWTGFVNRVWATLLIEIALIAFLFELFSSIRFKENIVPIDHALEKVMKLQGVYFNWKEDFRPEDRNRKMGLILEDVQPIVPEVVLPPKKGKLPEALAYPNLVALLIEAIKEQQTEIKKQQKDIEELTQRVDKLSDSK